MDRLVEPIEQIPFPSDLLRYGNELEISGVLLANGEDSELFLFPEASKNRLRIIQPTEEQWKELLNQLDTLGVKGLNKTILRKSQRQIEQAISWNVFRRDNYACQYCGKNDVPLTVDHIILWENMGASVEDNLISACRKCNKTRGNMEFPEWIRSEYFARVMLQWSLTDIPQHMSGLRSMYDTALKLPLRQTNRNR